ncbi:hypothetical protein METBISCDRAFT_30455 [Metschnikowia bicuspidata]|uniref:Uncharacterized protein n=1 Tax=Metschnikowia bicuspidata TaxID=27322 RepID=A0A4P9ZDP2_9ASCO|nr:hypothetical protein METBISCDRAFT_30455 [Metschnikowia bicuspidata]
MYENSLDALLQDISLSLVSTKKSMESFQTKYIDLATMSLPNIIQHILNKGKRELEGVSLLSLKSNSLLSYVNNLALVILSHLTRLQEEGTEEAKMAAVKETIEQRVTLEKGIKPLEKKLAYQLDKMVKSFHRMEEESAKMEQKIEERTSESKENDDDSSSSSEDSDEDDDALSYKPDAAALAKMVPSFKKKESKKSTKTECQEKYKPPKISAVAPPSAQFNDRAGPKNPTKKLQSMEEYLAEASDLPQSESSIGSTIVAKGKGGVKTNRERQREQEIQRYEESNFTRLSSTATKKSFKQKMAERVDHFAGEDWSMFSSNRNMKDGTSRKRKAATAWDRAKRKQT